MNLVLGGSKMRSPHLPTTILEVYVEALNGLGFVYYEDGLNNTVLTQDGILGSCCENPEQNTHHKNRSAEVKGKGLLIGLAGQQVIISPP